MASTFNLLYLFFNNAAFLLLSALGLIIILGMMDIINLAHGELMMMGAYVTTISYQAGVPFALAVALAFLTVGVFGALIERTLIRRFYGRELGALVLTWGIGLVLSQGSRIVFGSSMRPIPTPFGSFSYGGYSYSYYRLALIVMSVLVLAGMWWLYNRTTFGLHARATMQNSDMAKCLGVNTNRIYMFTFALGAALAGVSGALFAPTTTITPLMGQQFVVPAFIAVVVGGTASVFAGVAGSSTLLSAIQTPVGVRFGAYYGVILLLAAALIIIRILPNGVSSFLERLGDWLSDRRRRSVADR